MTDRVWTLQQLNEVHRLPDGLHWHDDGDGSWSAQPDDDDRSGDYSCFVWVDDGRTVLVSDGTSPEVALSVALVNLGLDSRETMAAELDRRSEVAKGHKDAIAGSGFARWYRGAATVLDEAAAMIRRGTVQP